MQNNKHRLFRLGSGAATQIWGAPPDDGHVYVCPQCMNRFTSDAIDSGHLTIDHVPPGRLGGNELVLTCDSCNCWSGTKLESHMEKRERVHDFLTGTLDRAEPVRITMGDGAMGADLTIAGGKRTLTGISKKSDPAAVRQLKHEFKRINETGSWEEMEFNLRFERRYSEQYAIVGWLRAAYLAAFAVFGYRYISRGALRIVRQQITKPNEELMGHFYGSAPQSRKSVRHIILIVEPSELESVFVQIGRHVVWLPWNSPQIYTRLKERSENETHQVSLAGLIGTEYPWPIEPMYGLDIPYPD